MKTFRFVHVVPSIADEASGPSYSVPRLCDALTDCGGEVILHTLEPRYDVKFKVHGHTPWSFLRRLGISPEMKRALKEDARKADILHNHGLWMMPNIYPASAVEGTSCRLVTSPRGTLSRWALGRSRWRKRLLWNLGQSRLIEKSACLHATAPSEYEEIREAGLRQPVAVIPNGVDIPPLPQAEENCSGRRKVLFLGRIHPKKGVDILLKAWRAVQDHAPEWDLEIAGPDDGNHLAGFKRMAVELGVVRAEFLGPLFGAEKSSALRQAGLFVLPTHSDNFALSVAEALAHGTPAIVSKGAPWSGLEEQGCGWWIDVGDKALSACLRQVLKMPTHELRSVGLRGRTWMERDFSWSQVGKSMYQAYQWLLNGGTQPECIRLN
ncbi:MAG TPA: glycosyltransferase [Planctomycetota bacterium]|nr:glycosyltransferase [Planctomycetota bacterium]